MNHEVYKEIYNAHKDVFAEIIKLCPHKPTVKLLEAQMRSDSKFIKANVTGEGCGSQH